MNPLETNLVFRLNGAVLHLQTGMGELAGFAVQRLAPLLEAQDLEAPGTGLYAEADVRVRLHWDVAPPLSWRSRGVRQWGRRLQQLGPRLLLSDLPGMPGLTLAAEWHAQYFYLEAYFQPPPRRLGWLPRSARAKAALFAALLYYLVYFPLFYFLEQARGWRLLHAAGVMRPAGVWLLAGLPGSGKTTFALSLLAEPDARLLSDNLLLFNRQAVCGVPERIHLNPTGQALLPADVQRSLQNTGRRSSYGRQEIELHLETTRRPVLPQALAFLGLGEQTDLLTVPAHQSVQRLAAFNELAREIQAYAYFSAALEEIALQPGSRACWQSDLETLLSTVPCYQLWLEPGADLGRAAGSLAREIEKGE